MAYYITREPLLDTESYFEKFKEIVKITDAENWEYYSENEREMTLSFLHNGSLSRIVDSCEDFGDGRASGTKHEPVAYVQMKVLNPLAVPLLEDDRYHDLGMSSKDLFLKSSEITKDTPLYVDVVAVKEEYKNKLQLLFQLALAVKEIIDSIDVMPNEVYAVGVTEEGRHLCKLFGGREPITTTKRSEINGEGNTCTHERALYEMNSDFLTKKLDKLAKRVKLKKDVFDVCTLSDSDCEYQNQEVIESDYEIINELLDKLLPIIQASGDSYLMEEFAEIKTKIEANVYMNN